MTNEQINKMTTEEAIAVINQYGEEDVKAYAVRHANNIGALRAFARLALAKNGLVEGKTLSLAKTVKKARRFTAKTVLHYTDSLTDEPVEITYGKLSHLDASALKEANWSWEPEDKLDYEALTYVLNKRKI